MLSPLYFLDPQLCEQRNMLKQSCHVNLMAPIDGDAMAAPQDSAGLTGRATAFNHASMVHAFMSLPSVHGMSTQIHVSV